MKIAIASDLHLEFGDINLVNEENAEVLILAGDVCVARHTTNNEMKLSYGVRYFEFFKRVAKQFNTVLYVMGNHEHYSNKFEDTATNLHSMLATMDNCHLLQRDTIQINGVNFIGATLWTDMNDYDELTMQCMKDYMNDYRAIKRQYTGRSGEHKFTPRFTVSEHVRDFDYIKTVASMNRGDSRSKNVVITHHAPSQLSIHEKYKEDTIMNGAFCSNLDDWIRDSSIDLWVHGHTHSSFDYNIGSTRVLCNPRGYIGYEESANTFKLKYIEL